MATDHLEASCAMLHEVSNLGALRGSLRTTEINGVDQLINHQLNVLSAHEEIDHLSYDEHLTMVQWLSGLRERLPLHPVGDRTVSELIRLHLKMAAPQSETVQRDSEGLHSAPVPAGPTKHDDEYPNTVDAPSKGLFEVDWIGFNIKYLADGQLHLLFDKAKQQYDLWLRVPGTIESRCGLSIPLDAVSSVAQAERGVEVVLIGGHRMAFKMADIYEAHGFVHHLERKLRPMGREELEL